VTRRHEADEQLRCLHQDLAATLKAIPDLRFEVDRAGRMVDHHVPTFLGLFVPPDVFLGRRVSDVLPPDAATVIMSAIEEAAERGWHSGSVYSLPMDGEERYFQLSIAAKGDSKAPDARFIALARDITALKRAENEVRLTAGQLRRLNLQLKAHSDRLDALVATRTSELARANAELESRAISRQEYLRAVAHELRTPANTILGVLELALGDLADDQREAYQRLLTEPRHRLMMALDAAVQLAAIEHDGGKLATEAIELRQAFWQAHEATRPELASRGVTVLEGGIWPGYVDADGESLRQCLRTLLQATARLATPGATVRLHTSNSSTQSTMTIELAGDPLPEGLARTFFDTFSTERSCSRVEDLGLAIPVAALVVQAMGGTLSVENVPAGVRFELVLTLANLVPSQTISASTSCSER
jgi:K+-sensing histidine kinase KdpD